MAKKDKDKKVLELVVKETKEEIKAGPTEEEINEQMKRDEEELNGYLSKFQTVSLPDSSKVEEEDEEEEETITLDLDSGKAYEKVGEGVAVRNEEGKIEIVEDEELADKIKKVLEKEEQPRLQKKYDLLLHDLLVSKALASLMKKLNDTETDLLDTATAKRMGMLSDVLEKEISDTMYKKRIELRKAMAGGKVSYDMIPAWAETYIEEYMRDAIGGLVELTERE